MSHASAWGSLAGRVVWGDKPGVDVKLSVIGSREVNGYPEACSLFVETKSDERGEFLIERLPPWLVQVSCSFGNKSDPIQFVFPYQHVTILEGKPIKMFNYGNMRRDFTYVDDVTEAIVRLIDHPPAAQTLAPNSVPDPGTSAAPWRVFATVTLPLALPGILAGMVLGFAKAIGEFGATITFVSNIPGETQTISSAIYSLIQTPDGDAAAARLVVISIVIAMAALIGSEWFARRATRRLHGN